MNQSGPFATGACTCGEIQFELTDRPLFVHCCHCTWCQRETGSAFAVNALIESDRVKVVKGQLESTYLPSASGKGQTLWRCPQCKVVAWSNYAGAGEKMRFIRVGTINNHDIRPDVHIFTSTKRPWVLLEPNIPCFPEYYQPKTLWPDESQERWRALMTKE